MRRHDPKQVKSFDESYSRSFKIEVLKSQAFRSLSGSAKSVCFVMYAKNDNSKFHKRKDSDGKPVFKFSVKDAKDFLGLNNRTFLDAVKQLLDRKLVERAIPHNPQLINQLGKVAEYKLCSGWRTWAERGKTPKERLAEMEQTTVEAKALQEKIEQRRITGLIRLGRMKSPEPVRKGTPLFESGQRVYFHKAEGDRAVLGNLIAPIDGGWRIMGLRTEKQFNPPSYDIPLERIETIEAVKNRSAKRNRKRTNSHHSEQNPCEKLHTRTGEKRRQFECAG